MTPQEMAKLRAINQTIAKTITVREAAELLNLSERQVLRLKKGVSEQGAAFVIHKNRGRKPKHTISGSIKERINENVTLTREMILNDQTVEVTVTNKKVNDSWFEDEDDNDNFFTVVVLFTYNQRPATIMQNLKAVLSEREDCLEAEDKTSS